nr:MAG TPA: nucelotide kinase [Caudoviricetes sp.]
MNDSAFIHEADQGRRFFQGKHGTSKSEKPNEKADAGTTHDKTQPDHYNDIMGMNLWEMVSHLEFIEGNILKYIWRAGLKEGVPAQEDYAKALTYLDRVKPEESLAISKYFFLEIPFTTLLSVAYCWEMHKIGSTKALMLHHFFHLLLHKKLIGEFQSKQQRKHHYDALRLQLIKEIEDEPPF